MQRERLVPALLLTAGLLFAGGAVITKYASLFDPAPRADVSHLIGLALGDTDPPLPHGDSLLSAKGVTLAATSGEAGAGAPGVARQFYSGPLSSAGESAVEPQPAAWAAAAAARDPAALRAWLGWAVLPVATTDGDTVRLRMYRPTLKSGCPLIDRIEATLTRPTGGWDTRVVRIDGGCWD